MKVFASEKRLKDVYVGATRYEVIKFRVMRFFRRLVIVTVISSTIAGISYGSFQAGRKLNPIISYADRPVDVSAGIYADKIESLKDNVVFKLMKCESAGYKESDGVVVLDTNKKFSFGRAQFQLNTVIYYYKTLYKKDITKKDAILIALDDVKAGQLAKDIMFKSKNLANDWKNCSDKLGLNNEIEIIKQLEK